MADKSRKKKKGQEPSDEDAAFAMELIRILQKKNDADPEKNKVKEEEAKLIAEMEEKNKKMIAIAEEKVKRKLKENLAKKLKIEKSDKLQSALESGDKIKWKMSQNGQKFEGFVDKTLMFEIKKGLTLFNLYVKNKELIKKNKLKKAYLSCSTNLFKLKAQSEKLI